MNLTRFLAVAVIALSARLAWAGETDCPRPDLWERYPQIKQQVDQGLAKLPAAMTALEPKAFAAKHPELARMAQSKDWAERVRSLRAIAALEDPAGIPLLVAGIMDRDAKDELSLLDAMAPLTMWIAGRSPRDRFKPLAPLFLSILVKTGDWPSVRCQCLQALGNLADRDWLPIVKDLMASRHPAVTNMSAWVVQQMSSRPGPGDDTRPAAASAVTEAGLIRVQSDTLCKPSEKELAGIVEKIKQSLKSPQPDREDDRIFYSDDIGWQDGWIPMSPSLKDKPPDVNYLRTWRYRRFGRVSSVTVTEPGKQPWVEQRVWYNDLDAPILSFRYYPANQPYYFEWGDYDAAGLLCRVVQLNADYSLKSVRVHDNGPKYCWTIVREFDAAGKLRSITGYVDREMLYTDLTGKADAKVFKYGWRVDWITKMEDFGLASFYPIPFPRNMDKARQQPGPQLRIDSVNIEPACVEEQCHSAIVVSNGGAGYRPAAGAECDSIMLRIYDDSSGRLIFRAGHAWSGFEPGKPMKLETDTHSNTLRAAGGEPFLFPKVGVYTLTITARRGDGGKLTDFRSERFYVGKDKSEFKLMPDRGKLMPDGGASLQ